MQSKYSQSATTNVMNLGTWTSLSSSLQENLELSLNQEHRDLDKENRQFFPCHVIQNTIPILSNGNFALCCFDAEGIINRNILKDSILETFNGEPYRILREFHRIHGASNALCSHCNVSIKKTKDNINILPPLQSEA